MRFFQSTGVMFMNVENNSFAPMKQFAQAAHDPRFDFIAMITIGINLNGALVQPKKLDQSAPKTCRLGIEFNAHTMFEMTGVVTQSGCNVNHFKTCFYQRPGLFMQNSRIIKSMGQR